MKKFTLWAMTLVVLVGVLPTPSFGKRPAPPLPPSRYGYELQFEAKSLPAGVSIVRAPAGFYRFSNTSKTPIIIEEIFNANRLVHGTKVEDNLVYGYFPSGIPQEGKTHLKGWQNLSKELTSANWNPPIMTGTIEKGRQPGLPGNVIPPPEPFRFPIKVAGQPHDITGHIVFHINPVYDVYYAAKKK